MDTWIVSNTIAKADILLWKMWGFILAITELAQTAPSHLKLVLSSPHFFGWLRKSEVPELIPAPPKSGQLRLKAKKDGSGCNFVIFSPEKVNN